MDIIPRSTQNPPNLDEFKPYLADMGLTEAQEAELLHAMWKIICACAEIGFKGDPIALVFQERENDKAAEKI